jgi:hypothetical protein
MNLPAALLALLFLLTTACGSQRFSTYDNKGLTLHDSFNFKERMQEAIQRSCTPPGQRGQLMCFLAVNCSTNSPSCGTPLQRLLQHYADTLNTQRVQVHLLFYTHPVEQQRVQADVTHYLSSRSYVDDSDWLEPDSQSALTISGAAQETSVTVVHQPRIVLTWMHISLQEPGWLEYLLYAIQAWYEIRIGLYW